MMDFQEKGIILLRSIYILERKHGESTPGLTHALPAPFVPAAAPRPRRQNEISKRSRGPAGGNGEAKHQSHRGRSRNR